MLNMSQINHIRDLKKKGRKISEIHEETGVDPKTIKKYLEKSDFSPSVPMIHKKPSVLDPFKDKISEYLEEDKLHLQKQHHTARRIFDRLTEEEGYTGSYDTVRKYVKDVRSD